MPAKVLLVFNDLVQSDLILYEKSNLNVELVNVLLCELVLTDMLDDSLS